MEHVSEGCCVVLHSFIIRVESTSNSKTWILPKPWFTVGLKYCGIVVSHEILILLLNFSFSVIHSEILVHLSRPQVLRRVDALTVWSIWFCRIVLWIDPIQFLWSAVEFQLLEDLELRHDSNDIWPPSFVYFLNPPTFCLFPSSHDNIIDCQRGLRLFGPRRTTSMIILDTQQEQKVVEIFIEAPCQINIYSIHPHTHTHTHTHKNKQTELMIFIWLTPGAGVAMP